jgi:cytochrome c oxidase subunit 2
MMWRKKTIGWGTNEWWKAKSAGEEGLLQKRESSAGSALIALVFAVVLVAITLTTIYFFVVQPKWGWFPPSITTVGDQIDAQFMRTLWITGVTFFLSQLALAWVIFRYRARPGAKASYSHGNTTFEILWTSATVLMFVGLGFLAKDAWADMYFRGAASGAVQVDVLAQQFAWNFRYPGADGKWGATDPKFMSDSGGNPMGLDPNDPAGKDDIVGPTIAVPVGREVELLLRTKDVTHSFFVRELRFKQDTVPGMVIRMHFKAEKEGTYEIACAELCGLGHHRMRSFLLVKSEAEYQKWLAEQAAEAQ